MVAIAAASAIKGASDKAKADKANKQAAQDAQDSESQRRESTQAAISDFFDQYNKLREERPGMTIEEYVGDRLKVLNNPQLQEAFRSLTQKDFEQAQQLADMATEGNTENFKKALDSVSGGFAQIAQQKRNDIANTDTSEEAYKRAFQLYAPYVPAGSVENQSNQDSALQRSNKGGFQVAYEVDQEQRQLQYTRLSDILQSDRNLALSQQERASTFMPATSFVNYATDLHVNQRRDQLAMQLADENFYQSIIGGLLQQGYTDQTKTPGFKDTSVYDKMIADGTAAAVKGAADIYARDQQNKQANKTAQTKTS